MKIDCGVEMLELPVTSMGKVNVFCPTLLWDNNTCILVDAGYPGQFMQVRQVIEKAGILFNQINKIIITHQDIDHVGCLINLINELPEDLEILAHEEEKAYLQGEKVPRKLTLFESERYTLSEENKVRYNILKDFYKDFAVRVDNTLYDREELPYCKGIEVIHTPGHSPGHICLYHKQSKTLITGDALIMEGDRLFGPNPVHTLDMSLALKSLEKLTHYDIKKVICYHGGIYSDNPNRRIAELISSSDSYERI
ncbi:MAG: hydrolase [Gracilibacter sp. BRH_c7a]|nr:MAG: hydrolase [Gracilibacter sp. BRH_c7a]